jgi:hypothetical protein
MIVLYELSMILSQAIYGRKAAPAADGASAASPSV